MRKISQLCESTTCEYQDRDNTKLLPNCNYERVRALCSRKTGHYIKSLVRTSNKNRLDSDRSSQPLHSPEQKTKLLFPQSVSLPENHFSAKCVNTDQPTDVGEVGTCCVHQFCEIHLLKLWLTWFERCVGFRRTVTVDLADVLPQHGVTAKHSKCD